jgi:hypothetical protein
VRRRYSSMRISREKWLRELAKAVLKGFLAGMTEAKKTEEKGLQQEGQGLKYNKATKRW